MFWILFKTFLMRMQKIYLLQYWVLHPFMLILTMSSLVVLNFTKLKSLRVCKNVTELLLSSINVSRVWTNVLVSLKDLPLLYEKDVALFGYFFRFQPRFSFFYINVRRNFLYNVWKSSLWIIKSHNVSKSFTSSN